ncbi:MAG: CHASE2 domain-containing protein, partial [Deltaproteobacteria bacterium]|nr:CHASE2 domain-containing protein [Deltaproteobacteria bacterium]
MNGKYAAKTHRKYLLGFVIAPLVIGFLASYADSQGRFERLNGIAWDYFKSQSYQRAPDPRILVIEIDDKTQNAFGWPLERADLGRVLRAARVHGARVVGLDMLFTEDSEWGEDD